MIMRFARILTSWLEKSAVAMNLKGVNRLLGWLLFLIILSLVIAPVLAMIKHSH